MIFINIKCAFKSPDRAYMCTVAVGGVYQKPLNFLKMDHSQIYDLYILICSPSTRNPSVRDEKQSALLAVVDYYVFIPLNKAINPCFMFWILK